MADPGDRSQRLLDRVRDLDRHPLGGPITCIYTHPQPWEIDMRKQADRQLQSAHRTADGEDDDEKNDRAGVRLGPTSEVHISERPEFRDQK